MIGIVVSSASKIVRRVIIPSADRSEIDNHPLGAGETMLFVIPPIGMQITSDNIATLVTNETGVVPPSSRCAVVVKANAVSGSVSNVIHADPAIDKVSGATLMLHPTAVSGWTWSSMQGLQPPANAVG